MIEKLGKKKFVEMVVNSHKNGKTLDQKDRGIKGRVRFRRCSHGIWIIDDYKEKPCLSCAMVPKEMKGKDFQSGFNIGLGCWVESRSEEKRAAKILGLTEAG